ncbi:RHS repeat-associated core domain-containing protein [Pseudomonas ogarae]|uniref:RHS repeat-associated core domain-containing protein n=1 Tax=Pseudomonas ogarae (strain DSM 112162 / CECT 30235 / F113) TaxID=1114970 RepID=UPI00023B3BC2|nr:RHS repeat-associated core domain-containing protein [Pseudomonas ogarae]AEV62411.1 YD repeat / insecticidal toxin protein [Pseudomonas ogarae]
MSALVQGFHTHTPTLTVIDPRSLTSRSVAYCRCVGTADAEERINRTAYDAMGRLIEQWDPRLWALSALDAPANLLNRYSLSGKVLASISVDAGERISLFGDGDQLVQTWDSRATERRIEYDDLLRPLAIFEQGEGKIARCSERYEYAGAETEFTGHNQCGQLIRHDDPVGTQTLDEYALTGGVLEQAQRFLRSLEIPDWPPGLSERDALLEPVEQAATSVTHFNPLGDVLEQTDAKGNRQSFDHTVDGQLFATHLQLSAQATAQTLVSALAYNAYGQVEQEIAGNGVISTLTYRPEDGRLLQLEARRGTQALQDLRYAYDPVGNVLSIEDAALPIRYFANQRVEPINRYDYDSLYQLIKATGWEAGSANRGPAFNRFDDPGAVANYQQTYHYDAAGNLLELVHVGPQNHSRKLTAARYSNRCLPEQNDRPPTEEEIAAAFDGNGNLLELQPRQTMAWDLRNQLREVRPVERDGIDDDRELYLYGSDGMRRRKIRSTQTNARSLVSEVRYLPGLETRTHAGTGEVLQVICGQAGRSAMQVLHWETTPPAGMTNDQYRYNLTDHLGSSSLELDGDAQVISQETYHPYGGTAWFAGRSDVEASYKTVRYSGKERDATGLYYYGFRYYAPWLQRWINPDPAGDVDGLNVYAMTRGNPITLKDNDGKQSTFQELFQPSRGDLIFGLSSSIEQHMSWWGALRKRGDYTSQYLSGDDIGRLADDLNATREKYNNIKDRPRYWASPPISANNEQNQFWGAQYKELERFVSLSEKIYYSDIQSRYGGWLSTLANRNFAASYASEMADSHYSIKKTFEKFIGIDDAEFEKKLVSRASKAGLLTALNLGKSNVVHFLLDDLDLEQVILKTRPSATSSELRYIFRNQEKFSGKIEFYKDKQRVDAPWITDPIAWKRYVPKVGK